MVLNQPASRAAAQRFLKASSKGNRLKLIVTDEGKEFCRWQREGMNVTDQDTQTPLVS